jgi:hypothetical protein
MLCDDSQLRRTLSRQARSQHGLAIRPRMAPLLRFFLPTAPYASRVLFSDTAEAVNRTCAYLTHDLSAFSVSHALDGFLLAWHRRFVSPDRHSWDSPLQSCSLSRSRGAFRRSLPSCRLQERLSLLLAFRALLHARIRWPPPVFPPGERPRCSLGAFPLQGSHPPRGGTAFAAPPLQDRSIWPPEGDASTVGLRRDFFAISADRERAQITCCPSEY